MTLEIPEPPEGEDPWAYVLVGEALGNTDDGQDLIARLEADGVLVEILLGGEFTAQYQPQVPPDAKLRAFRPATGIVKPEELT